VNDWSSATLESDQGVSQDAGEKSRLKEILSETKWIIVAFLILCAVTLPCACCAGYRTQWLLWQLGLR
jgi:hypothetical protein